MIAEMARAEWMAFQATRRIAAELSRERQIRGRKPVPNDILSETDEEAEGIRGASLLAECGAGKNDGRSGTKIPPPKQLEEYPSEDEPSHLPRTAESVQSDVQHSKSCFNQRW